MACPNWFIVAGKGNVNLSAVTNSFSINFLRDAPILDDSRMNALERDHGFDRTFPIQLSMPWYFITTSQEAREMADDIEYWFTAEYVEWMAFARWLRMWIVAIGLNGGVDKSGMMR